MCKTATSKKYKSIIKKRKRSTIKISKALNDSVISHDEFVLINIVLEEYNEVKEKIKNLTT